jgi:hypothetical protein
LIPITSRSQKKIRIIRRHHVIYDTIQCFDDSGSIYGNSFDSSSSALIMPIGLVSVLDPWSAGGALQTTISAIVDVFQLTVVSLIYDCDVFDDS